MDAATITKRSKVYIIYAGGTIGMKKYEDGYRPAPKFLEEKIKQMPEFEDPLMPEYVINEYNPLLDSSDMDPSDWKKIAEDIRDHYEDYNGFVIIHGTDTMAYTASALSFMLENLGKIVVLTGSQIPLAEIRNDARANLIGSVMIAGKLNIPEVCVYFDDKLFRGNRCTKIDIWGFNAFHSFNYPPLATIGVDITFVGHTLHKPTKKFTVQSEMSEDIVALRLFPGLSARTLRELFGGTHIKGIVLEVFGAGNAPERKREFMQVIEDTINRGVVIVTVSQAPRGAINMSQYATGQKLKSLGVVSGHDMTVEAALTKLQYLFGKGLSPEQVKEQMNRSIAGELTPTAESALSTQLPADETLTPPHDTTHEDIDHHVTFQYHSSLKYSRPGFAVSPSVNVLLVSGEHSMVDSASAPVITNT